MAQFINSRETLVTSALDGTLRLSRGALVRLDGYPDTKVILRAERDPAKVALVSGGGSGHEPAHAGFVGRGMLTAAVCGEVFASPSMDAVLAGILAVTGEAGCLLIVKNYTGDRLNFGLAAERARALGRKVEMVVVDDDVAIPDIAQARGVAGTLFVHKIAGALADEGADLATVAAAARKVVGGVVSIGMSLSTCWVPGAPRQDRIPEGRAELGLGIHGEPGVETVAFESARAAVALMVERLRPHLGTGRHALLLNNLGGCTPLEMGVIAEEIALGDLAPMVGPVIGPAALMTSLDMRGVSLSLLPVDAEAERALATPVDCAAWPGLRSFAEPVTVALPEGLQPRRAAPSEDAAMRALILAACAALEAEEDALNALDARSGDGDTGSTLAGAARGVASTVDTLPLADTAGLLRGLSIELGSRMGGSSGVLLAILFAAAADAAGEGADWPAALMRGADRVSEVGGASEGDRTMLDALLPALRALSAGEGLAAAATAARQGADATAAMSRARAGRSAYVSADALTGHADPGAEAVARLIATLTR
ncbi:MAG: dihydroxyacetone kinase subunit DhaK [Pseudomonadota bacterium]